MEKTKVSAPHHSVKSLFTKPNDVSAIKNEALFTNFFVNHNSPLFAAANQAGPLLKKMFPDTHIASKYGCGRTKTTAIVRSFSDLVVEEIVENLKSSKYTVGSNMSENEKLFPILVSYFDTALEKKCESDGFTSKAE